MCAKRRICYMVTPTVFPSFIFAAFCPRSSWKYVLCQDWAAQHMHMSPEYAISLGHFLLHCSGAKMAQTPLSTVQKNLPHVQCRMSWSVYTYAGGRHLPPPPVPQFPNLRNFQTPVWEWADSVKTLCNWEPWVWTWPQALGMVKQPLHERSFPS